MNLNEATPQIVDTHLSSTIITNRTIANYKLVELRGSGGMANIFKAIQLSLDRPIALKIMHPHLNSNEAFIARFEKEAKRAASLQHENIVSIIDYGCDNSEYYIAMEYIDGTNLNEMLKKQKRMPLEVSLFICHQVAEGLKYAHSQSIIHRDIKPANIMLSFDGRVMVTDFGIAKAVGDMTITSTGQVIGSPSYMSPEQAAGKPIDHRSDIFSLGIILYEMIAGEKPFRGETYQNLVASIMSDHPASLHEMRVDVTPEIDQLVLKSLSKSVDSRYQSAEEFSEAILAQLTKFKIPSTRKMMFDYIKSPIRVTERLRTDKITDHMESALYFLAVGEGKLAEARREFQEVLRFDKYNKEAKKFLTRLDSHPSLRSDSGKERKWVLGLTSKHAFGAAIILFVIFMVFLLIPHNESIQTDKKPVIVEANGGFSNPKLIINTDPIETSPPVGNTPSTKPVVEKSSIVLSKELPRSETPEIIQKAVAENHPVLYNYPNQSLVRYGNLLVVTDLPAKIRIDDQDFGYANGPSIKLSPGRHILEIEANGYRKARKRVSITKGESDTLIVNLAP
jgi:serine/threonine protein kinase